VVRQPTPGHPIASHHRVGVHDRLHDSGVDEMISHAIAFILGMLVVIIGNEILDRR
jgi:hypothetical protein